MKKLLLACFFLQSFYLYAPSSLGDNEVKQFIKEAKRYVEKKKQETATIEQRKELLHFLEIFLGRILASTKISPEDKVICENLYYDLDQE